MLVACESDDGQDSDHHPCLAARAHQESGPQIIFFSLDLINQLQEELSVWQILGEKILS